MKTLLLTLLACAMASSSAADRVLKPAITQAEAQQAHAQGQCGTLGPGTGLLNGRGWVASMFPGPHEFRVKGGTVAVTVQQRPAADFDPGRLVYIVVSAPPGAVLEWRMADRDWGPVARAFLYPPEKR